MANQFSLALLITLSCFVYCVYSMEYDQKRGFRMLEDYLKSELGENWDVQLNLDKIQQNLDMIQSKSKYAQRDLQMALWEFSGLKSIWENPKCDRAQDLHLFRFMKETQGRKYYADPKKELKKRLDFIVHQVSLRAAEKCRLEYPKIFAEIYPKFNPLTKNVVENFKNNYFDKVSSEFGTNIERQKWFLRYLFVINNSEINAAIEYLKKIANYKDDDLRSALVIYVNHLKWPCIDYLNEIGIQVITGAINDSRMFKGLSGWHFDENDENLTMFYRAIANFEICSVIVYHKEFQMPVVNGLSDSIKVNNQRERT